MVANIFRSIFGRTVGFDENGIIFKGQYVGQSIPRGNGRDYYVHSSGRAGGTGALADPANTVVNGLALATASQGDRVILLEGHSETLGNETIALAKAGVEIVGLGYGATQARFIFGHASSKITLGAHGMKLRNCRFSASITSVAVGVDILAGFDDVEVSDNLFDATVAGTDEFVISIQNNAGCDRTRIRNNVIDMGIAGAAVGVKLTGASDRVLIEGNDIAGDFSTACINGITTLSTKLRIQDNLLVQGIGGDINAVAAIVLLTGTTGIIRRNDIVANLATKAAAIVADTCLLFRNYYNEDISGAATGGEIGTASADD